MVGLEGDVHVYDAVRVTAGSEHGRTLGQRARLHERQDVCLIRVQLQSCIAALDHLRSPRKPVC